MAVILRCQCHNRQISRKRFTLKGTKEHDPWQFLKDPVLQKNAICNIIGSIDETGICIIDESIANIIFTEVENCLVDPKNIPLLQEEDAELFNNWVSVKHPGRKK